MLKTRTKYTQTVQCHLADIYLSKCLECLYHIPLNTINSPDLGERDDVHDVYNELSILKSGTNVESLNCVLCICASFLSSTVMLDLISIKDILHSLSTNIITMDQKSNIKI